MDEIDFKKLEKADKPVFDKFYKACYYENSHFNFTNLYMWREPFNLQWAIDDDVLFQISEWNGKASALQPVGDPGKMQGAIKKILDWFAKREKDNKVYIMGFEKSFAE